MTETDDQPTIAITGGAGYIGSRVIGLLQAHDREWEIRAIDNFYRGDVREVGDVTIEHVDIRDRRRLDEALEGADVVVHLAAVSGVDDCAENGDLAYEVNVTGTSNVAWFCRESGAALIFPFSMGVLGDPTEFPITIDQPRTPMHWYGRTKVLGEHLIEDFAEDAFPAHLFLKSNLYGDHEVDGRTITKGTVINFFVSRVFADEPLTVYEPGTQARNYVHVKDVARAYVRSVERLLEALEAGKTGAEKYEIASDEDPSVMSVAELVREIAREETDRDPDVELVENPREGEETLVDAFAVDTSAAREELDWQPEHTVEDSIRELLRKRATAD